MNKINLMVRELFMTHETTLGEELSVMETEMASLAELVVIAT